MTSRHTGDLLHIPWNVFDMLWFHERDKALHTQNHHPGGRQAPEERKERDRSARKEKKRMTRKRWEMREVMADG